MQERKQNGNYLQKTLDFLLLGCYTVNKLQIIILMENIPDIKSTDGRSKIMELLTNTASVSGVVSSEATFSHEVYGEGFYNFYVDVPRLSEATDRIPVTVSERLITPDNIREGDKIEVTGQFRSYNNYTEMGNRLLLTLFARDINFPEISTLKNPNDITLVGYICKPPVYRHTPFGREIADILLAVNRSYNKSDYIPCIAWGRNARYTKLLNVGDKVKISGRIQSREYRKKLSEDDYISKVAYEVSVIKLEEMEEEQTDMSS